MEVMPGLIEPAGSGGGKLEGPDAMRQQRWPFIHLLVALKKVGYSHPISAMCCVM
jgi:hypothetical protein